MQTETADGLKLDGDLFAPLDSARTVIIYLGGIGYGLHSRHLTNALAVEANKNNMAFLEAGTRGRELMTWVQTTAGRQVGGHAVEDINDAPVDLAAWVDLANEDFDQIILAGHSIGGAKILKTLGESMPRNLSGLAFLAPVDPIDFHNKLDPAGVVYGRALQEYLYGDPRSMIDGGRHPISAATYMQFNIDDGPADVCPLREKRRIEGLSEVECPVMVIFGNEDRRTSNGPKEDARLILASATRAPHTQMVLVSGSHTFRGVEGECALHVASWASEIDLGSLEKRQVAPSLD